jgi:hypothetical protein
MRRRQGGVTAGRQDPLREMAGMCVGDSKDLLSLQLHPLQHVLDPGELLRFLHRAFVAVVNEVPPPSPLSHAAPAGSREQRTAQSSTAPQTRPAAAAVRAPRVLAGPGAESCRGRSEWRRRGEQRAG